jgi:hypothetical protein
MDLTLREVIFLASFVTTGARSGSNEPYKPSLEGPRSLGAILTTHHAPQPCTVAGSRDPFAVTGPGGGSPVR